MVKIINRTNAGFTVVELIVVMMFFSILLGTVTVNLLGSTYRASLNSQITTLVSDLKNQQQKAMSGYTGGTFIGSDFGIFFENNRYILFRGPSYNSADTANYIVNLDPNLSFSTINIPASTIVFTKGNGEVKNYSLAQNSLALQNNTNLNHKTLTINKLGVIVTLN